MFFSLKQIHQHDDERREQSAGPIAHGPGKPASSALLLSFPSALVLRGVSLHVIEINFWELGVVAPNRCPITVGESSMQEAKAKQGRRISLQSARTARATQKSWLGGGVGFSPVLWVSLVKSSRHLNSLVFLKEGLVEHSLTWTLLYI